MKSIQKIHQVLKKICIVHQRQLVKQNTFSLKAYD